MAIIEGCREDELTILMRRFMMRCACALAEKNGIQSVSTGESIGQVASQTMEGLVVSTDCADRPVFRPLITMDKGDIMDIAREIGTSVDIRTTKIMNKGYKINYPAEYSMREVLENIAAMYAGSFVMSDTGELLLVTMFGIPKETSYLIDGAGFAITFGGERILV